jgi:hypothetical protein
MPLALFTTRRAPELPLLQAVDNTVAAAAAAAATADIDAYAAMNDADDAANQTVE